MRSIFQELPQDIPAQAAETVGRVPAFDADRGRFLLRDGALLERGGGEAVKQWFELALRQQIDRIPIYRTQGAKKYGVPRDLIGGKLPQGLAAAEMERGVRETASYNPAVREIRELRLSRERRTCVVEFTAVLHTGESVEVSVDVQRG